MARIAIFDYRIVATNPIGALAGIERGFHVA
jgi:hypothetical protein